MKWQLHFNPTKCKHLTYGKPRYDSMYTMTNTDAGVTDIDNTPETEKDLGVTFDCSLKFRQHIGTVVKKTIQIMGLIKHTCKHMDCTVFRLVYTELVRPHLHLEPTLCDSADRHKHIRKYATQSHQAGSRT